MSFNEFQRWCFNWCIIWWIWIIWILFNNNLWECFSKTLFIPNNQLFMLFFFLVHFFHSATLKILVFSYSYNWNKNKQIIKFFKLIFYQFILNNIPKSACGSSSKLSSFDAFRTLFFCLIFLAASSSQAHFADKNPRFFLTLSQPYIFS